MTTERPKGDRGGGIQVSRGGFRIRNFSLSLDATTGELVGSTMTPELRADIFHHWLRIAEQAAADSEAARAIAVDADRDDNETFNDALEQEFRASLVGVAASAFAIDAFYASVVEHAPETKVPANTREARIFEAFRRAFTLSRTQQSRLREFLRLLFGWRDEAVHPPATWVEPVGHPIFNIGMEPRFVKYRCENARSAFLLAQQLIAVCLRCPRKKHVALAEWCGAVKDVLPEPTPISAPQSKS